MNQGWVTWIAWRQIDGTYKRIKMRYWLKLAVMASLLVSYSVLAKSDSVTEAKKLKLEDVIRIGIKNNIDSLEASLNMQNKEFLFSDKKRAWIPRLLVNMNQKRQSDVLDFDSLESVDRSQDSWVTQVEQNTIWGTQLGVAITSTKDKLEGNDYSDQASLSLYLKQPLLQNSIHNENQTEQKLAEKDLQQSQYLFRRVLNNLIVILSDAYFELYLANRKVTIGKDLYQLAQSQYEQVKKKIDRGILAGDEIFLAEESLVSYEIELVASKQEAETARRRLGILMNESSLSNYELDESIELVFEKPNVLELKNLARKNDPTLKTKEIELAKAQISDDLAQNQLLPRLDFTIEKTFSRDSYNISDNPSLDNKPEELRFALSLSVPLDFHLADNAARLSKNKVDLEQEKLNYYSNELDKKIESLSISLISKWDILQLSKKKVRLSAKKYDAEKRKYENGITNLRVLLEFQEDANRALISYQSSEINYLKQKIRLRSALGDLFKDYNVVLKDEGRK